MLPVTELHIGGIHSAADPKSLAMVKRAFKVKGYKITPIDDMAQSHILCKRKTVHFENIDHYDETGKKMSVLSAFYHDPVPVSRGASPS